MMAGAGFLALAHTLKRGEHIRVTLLLAVAAGASAARARDLGAVRGLAARAALAYYSCRLAWQSYAFHDISTSNDATPLWMPQIAMALGAVVLAIAFIDELVLEIRGERVVRSATRRLRNE